MNVLEKETLANLAERFVTTEAELNLVSAESREAQARVSVASEANRAVREALREHVTQTLPRILIPVRGGRFVLVDYASGYCTIAVLTPAQTTP